jgi:hypothetical protein
VRSGAGLLWIGVQWLESRRTPEGFSLWFGLVPIALALLLAMRRILFDRCLVLDDDHMILPTGLLQSKRPFETALTTRSGFEVPTRISGDVFSIFWGSIAG